MYDPGFAKSKNRDRSRRSGLKRAAPVPIPVEIVSAWTLRVYVFALIFALPWYFGCAPWLGQQYLYLAAILLSVLTAIHCFICVVKKKSDQRLPWISWVFFGLGCFAWLQSLPVFTWDSSWLSPPSVAIQRWALGIAPAPARLAPDLLTELQEPNVESVPCDLKDVPQMDRKLAWSVEPLHTKAAIAALFLCGLLVWVGKLVFSEPKMQLLLFGGLTLIGVVIACFGIQCAISYRTQNFLGLTSGGSFATFVSKNSAGGFLNVCIAGSLGLLGWTLLNTKRKSNDMRYRFPDSNVLLKTRGLVEDFLSDLNTPQITAMLCLVTIVAALVISLCRGAAISGFAAIIAAIVIANAKNQNRGSSATVFAILLVSLACILGFQLDDQAYSRLESISEIDFEEELRLGRAYIWGIAFKATQFYGLFGSGLGTFHFAYLPFQKPSSNGWYYHAESLYAQCSVELGWIGLSILVVSVFAVFLQIRRVTSVDHWRIVFPAKLASVYLLFSQALHSFVDFAIIIPSLFVPACVLLGSTLGMFGLLSSKLVVKRKSKDQANNVSAKEVSNSSSVTSGVFSVLMCSGLALGFYFWNESVRSLALSDSMSAWSKLEDAKPLMEQNPNRVLELARIWGQSGLPLEENPAAMRNIADALVFDYRIAQVANVFAQAESAQAWINSSPIFVNMVLSQETKSEKRQQIIQAVGGTSAVEKLRSAAKWYGLGQLRSPLDWQFLWGRCSTNLTCSSKEMEMLISPHNQLARHNAQRLLLMSVLYRNSLSNKQLEAVRVQAMKSSTNAAINVAKLMASESQDEDISIDAFPQKSEVLQSLALQVFDKEKFPKTYLALWERAKKLITSSSMTEARREIWLADAAKATDDKLGEINYLKNAIRYEPSNLKLLCRIVKQLMELGEIQQARKYCDQARRLDPLDLEVRELVRRLLDL